MSYFSEWNRKVEDDSNKEAFNAFVSRYYELEQNAYKQILTDYPEENLKGKASELQERLGFDGDMEIFLGFLEGVNPALEESLELDTITDDTELDLKIKYETLLYNMHDAKAAWLYELEAWSNVLTKEERSEIAKQYRTDHIAVSTKVGRNDPCPCGSGKKYKLCCGKN